MEVRRRVEMREGRKVARGWEPWLAPVDAEREKRRKPTKRKGKSKNGSVIIAKCKSLWSHEAQRLQESNI